MREKIKILHLEDNSQDAELIKEMLLAGGIDADISVISKGSEYLTSLEDNDFDIVISDYNLPEFDGLKALLETQKKRKDIPFIYCSGTIGEERAVQCLQYGAMDYVLKQRLDRLVPAVNRALRLVKEKRQREYVEQQLNRIMLAVENTNESICITDTEGTIIYVNPHFTKVYGWTKDEIISKENPRILKSGKHSSEFYDQMWKTLIENKTVKLDMINKSKDGKLIEINNMISAVFDETNKLIGYVSIQTDISLKKQQEREILKAKTDAEEMNKLKSVFLANINHEFRTPLISILGFSEILMNELTNPEQSNSARYIYESGQRLQKTLNDFLILAEIEKKKLVINFRKTELKKHIKDISGTFEKQASKKGLIFKLLLDRRDIWINSDPELITNILTDIFDNALKFTKQGGISISVELEQQDENPKAIIKIMDSGVGITPEKIEFIFAPFRQESEGLNRTFEGMGLGLTVAKQMIELLNGEIGIISKVSKGTMVTIKFPALRSEKEIKDEIGLRKTTIIEQPLHSRPTKPIVLIVEDNPINRALFRKYLIKDFSVEEAEDGISATAMAEMKTYDIVLMDISLGMGMDGIEAFQRIKELVGYKNVPIIALTAFATKDEKQKFLDYGFTEFIQKPVLRNEFVELIKKLIKESKR